jgi:hypothetical protein
VKILSVSYMPMAEVEFTWTEVECMILFSERHYDYKCRELSKCGGELYGMRNKFDAKLPLRLGGPDDLAARKIASITWTLDSTLAGLLAKTVESDPALLYKLMQIAHKLEAEWRKMNRKGTRNAKR